MYSLTIFLSSFLLFIIQPIIGKQILPLFGGGFSVWTTLMMFFTGALFLGYLYAVLLSRLSANKQRSLHLATIVTCVVLTIGALLIGSKWDILALPLSVELTVLITAFLQIGLPFFLLATTSPLLQFWFTKDSKPTNPFSLYAISNAGALIGIILYPFFIEPLIYLKTQKIAWYIFFAFFSILLSIITLKVAPKIRLVLVKISSFRFFWFSLSFVSSLTLVATTSYITQSISPIPFLWLAPLALHLLSYIIAFSGQRWYRREFHATFLLSVLLINGLVYSNFTSLTYYQTTIFSLVSLFLLSLVAHAELYESRPERSSLTIFYLMISFGGLVAATFSAIVAPIIFTDLSEYPLGIFLGMLLVFYILVRLPKPRSQTIQLGLFCIITISGFIYGLYQQKLNLSKRSPFITLEAKRNFYGITSVLESPAFIRQLMNGKTTQGYQFLTADKKYETIEYYTKESGVGLAISTHPLRLANQPMRIGVVGLGVGAIVAYCQPKDEYTFYEINPDVVAMSQKYFTFLNRCQSLGGSVNILAGDARLTLAKQPPQKFDILVIDAFTNGAIPTHLLTKEALSLYQSHLSDSGILALHITNRLNLRPTVLVTAANIGLKPYSSEGGGSRWVLLSKQELSFGIAEFPEYFPKSIRPWTDDYSNILQALTYRP